ncbi:UNVERIFIED_CONTAM: hypothetical protein Slati_1329500 [Sesamum latifolium]|uniref:DUF4283 domain-containing protein n=1 Tax=Sesamum latifolium TaxID=2727402 RepID=A0AAW2XHG0_9LAMI
MVPTSNTSGSRLEEVLPIKTGQTEATGTTKISFAGLFSTNRRLMDKKKLRKIEDKDETLKLEMNDLIDVRSKLGHCLVGYIAGKFPGLKAIGALSKSWEATFQQHASGWLVFKFANRGGHATYCVRGTVFCVWRSDHAQIYASLFRLPRG